MSKKMLIIAGAFVIVLIVLIATVFISTTLFSGISNVRIEKSLFGKAALKVDYADITGYKIIAMDESDPMFVGEKEVVVDDFGKNRVAIWFSDAKVSKSLSGKYPEMINTLQDVPSEYQGKFHIRFARPADDAKLILYIGTDEPIEFENKAFEETSFGTVKIEL